MSSPIGRHNVVYFVRDPLTGAVKIGCTKSIRSRLSALRREMGRPLVLLATLPGDHHLETRFHARFYALHVDREWFQADPSIDETVEAILAGDLRLSSLPAGPSPLLTAASMRGHATRRERAAAVA